MTTKRRNLPAFLLFLAMGAAPCAAQEANLAPGTAYSQARASLMAQGWKPDASYGLKIANGSPLYRYPEVLCGPELCRAKWRDRAGGEHAILLKRGYNNEEHRVAQ
jgi:hypothetical protein